MLTKQQAISTVQKRLPGYAVDWCISYKDAYVVMAHPDDGPEDSEHGAYPNPFYWVNAKTGRVYSFVPRAEKDLGKAFFNAVKAQVSSHHPSSSSSL